MKLKTIIFIAILIILAVFFINYSSKKKDVDFKPVDLEVGDIFDKLDYSDSMYVINYAISDITGDGENDMVIVVGKKENVDSMKAEKVDVVVFDTEKQLWVKAGLKNYIGSNPKIQLEDYTGDGIKDILVSLENDDRTKNVRVIALNEGVLKEIWNKRDNRGLVFVGEVVDGAKAHLRCGKFSKESYVDLIDMKQILIENAKINESGKMIAENNNVSTTGITSIDIIDLNGRKGIQTTQKMIAFSDMMIDEITCIWKYVDGKWQVVEAKTNRLGVL